MKSVVVFVAIVASCLAVAAPFGLLFDKYTTDKSERIERLEDRGDTLEKLAGVRP